jgi:hypothetical protein
MDDETGEAEGAARDRCNGAPLGLPHPFFAVPGQHHPRVQLLLDAATEAEWLQAAGWIVESLFSAWAKKEPSPIYRPFSAEEHDYIWRLGLVIQRGFQPKPVRAFSLTSARRDADLIRKGIGQGIPATMAEAARLIAHWHLMSLDAARKRIADLERRGFIEKLPRAAPFRKDGGA